MYDDCRECGESVRTGLVRCWNCNAFMRSDVENTYKEMKSTPQAIIFSDVPKEQRTEFMPARDSDGHVPWGRVYDADDSDDDASGFSLRSDGKPAQKIQRKPDDKVAPKPTTDDGDDDFELDAGVGSRPATAPEKPVTPAAPAADAKADAKPPEKADGDKPDDAKAKQTSASAKPKAPDDFDVDDLVGIALEDQRETRRKKKAKIQEAKRQRILMPC